MAMVTIDGSQGEGGGQILRTALALSLATGTPVRIDDVRAGRERPGLLRQHLTALRAAVEISGARVVGAELGSRAVTFEPGAVVPGSYRFAVGTAGSATLVLQTVLPPLLVARGASELVLEGGTHNPKAPPFDFLQRAFLPLVERMGPRVRATLERPGFYPAGGGRFRVAIEPAPQLAVVSLLERGEVRRRSARALVANLPRDSAVRELGIVRDKLGWAEADLAVEEVAGSPGPGNVLLLEVECDGVTEIASGFGERNVRAEAIARGAVDDVRRWLAARVPVGQHLADQLLVPMALAGGGAFRTLALSRHARTNAAVIQRLLPVDVAVEETARDDVRVEIRARG